MISYTITNAWNKSGLTTFFQFHLQPLHMHKCVISFPTILEGIATTRFISLMFEVFTWPSFRHTRTPIRCDRDWRCSAEFFSTCRTTSLWRVWHLKRCYKRGLKSHPWRRFQGSPHRPVPTRPTAQMRFLPAMTKNKFVLWTSYALF